ncbi:MAG: hypothetical protein ABIK89_15585 [Planctomycetota bacterium]
MTEPLKADLAEGLRARVDALIGAAWDVGLTDAPPALERVLVRDLETVTADLLEQALSPTAEAPPETPAPSEAEPPPEENPFDLDALDKVILLVVLPVLSEKTGYRVIARELDVRTRQWNSPVTVPAWQVAKLCDAAFRAVSRAFAPLAQIVAVDEKQVTLRLRAAGLPTRDNTIVPVKPGQVFRPVVRHNDRNGKLRAANPIPWTFLTVDEITPAGLTSTLHTGIRTPLSGRRRGRFEQLALAVVPPGKPTRLVLQSRTDPDEVLIGYDVFSHPPGSKSTEFVGRTDPQGAVVIPPAEHPLRVLLVKNGGEFLGRLPLVPGVEPEVSAAIANDDQRLEAEGFITGLQEELIDLVTRREVLLAQASRQLEEKEFDEAEKLVRQLQGLEGRDDFALHMTQEEKKVFSPDRLIQAKIDAMFSKTRKLVAEYLNPSAIDQLDRQLHEARSAGRL